MTAPDKPYFPELLIREKYALPEGWEIFRWEAIANGVLFTGASAPKIQRGKRLGRPNWRKMDRRTKRQFFLSDDEVKARESVWERETGKCSRCGGDGQEWTGWDHVTGNSYGDCRRCDATGRAREGGG